MWLPAPASRSTDLLAAVRDLPSMTGQDLASAVTCSEPYEWIPDCQAPPAEFRVVAYDFGIKLSILRNLTAVGCRVTVVPAHWKAEQVLEMRPDGVFLSNGPGDPAAVGYAVETIRGLLGKVPIFGICLGHQLLALALGLSTYKLKFGHRGINHPVRNYLTGRIEITSQNHGFAVEPPGVVSEVLRDPSTSGPAAMAALSADDMVLDLPVRTRSGDPSQPQRRDGRGSPAPRPPGLLRAVSSGGRAWSPRQPLSVPRVHTVDAGSSVTGAQQTIEKGKSHGRTRSDA